MWLIQSKRMKEYLLYGLINEVYLHTFTHTDNEKKKMGNFVIGGMKNCVIK